MILQALPSFAKIHHNSKFYPKTSKIKYFDKEKNIFLDKKPVSKFDNLTGDFNILKVSLILLDDKRVKIILVIFILLDDSLHNQLYLNSISRIVFFKVVAYN